MAKIEISAKIIDDVQNALEMKKFLEQFLSVSAVNASSIPLALPASSSNRGPPLLEPPISEMPPTSPSRSKRSDRKTKGYGMAQREIAKLLEEGIYFQQPRTAHQVTETIKQQGVE